MTTINMHPLIKYILIKGIRNNAEKNEKNIRTGITCKHCQMLTELFEIHILLESTGWNGSIFCKFNFKSF